ncbi:MAG: NAD(P)/FAD-dependent oxidoreductase [Alphaproteobacteria bacterium]
MTDKKCEFAGKGVVIIGGGQAGHQTAESLRAGGYTDPIRIVGTETHLPYQQPPLSKAFLKNEVAAERLPFRNAAYFAEKEICLNLSETVVEINAKQKTIRSDKSTYGFDKLVIATGSTPRRLPVEGADLTGIVTLRTLDDAEDLKARFATSKKVVIIGAGFIGLEVASTALHLGLDVTVVEAMDRVMARVVSPTISEFFQDAHKAKGLNLKVNTFFDHFVGQDGQVSGVTLKDGSTLECDLVLLGIGATANDQLAKDAGLATENGIVVDAQMRTSNPDIYAIGDCSFHPNQFWGGMFRLESVQNAIDQGKVVATHVLGEQVEYKAVPWFWSDQQGYKLQMVGLPKPDAEQTVFGSVEDGAFTVLHTDGGFLTGVETVNQPAEQMAARQLLVMTPAVSVQELTDAGDLKTVLKARRAAAKG